MRRQKTPAKVQNVVVIANENREGARGRENKEMERYGGEERKERIRKGGAKCGVQVKVGAVGMMQSDVVEKWCTW